MTTGTRPGIPLAPAIEVMQKCCHNPQFTATVELMAHSMPARQDGTGSEKPSANDHDGARHESDSVPLWLAHLQLREGQKTISTSAPETSITIELDKADYEALSRKARLTGNRVVDVIHTAVQREIGNKPHVITLMHRWNLHREDLNMAAESLGVDQLSEAEWGQIGIRPFRRR
ncbi:hypothetical protein ABZ260_09350 [Streptosporangium sp. NPDC006013]|jgi:hypothetical protein|uniref:hypothetical protein n=1 Tax=Streptosporangium sp. NPDC006013 TaxID=3155596 RepID=UPI00339FB6FF